MIWIYRIVLPTLSVLLLLQQLSAVEQGETFAAYNAGPGRVSQLRKLAEKRGLNPNVWFNNVEVIAAEKIGRETVTYVSNIYKYYIAYNLVTEEQEERKKAMEEFQKKPAGSK
jgi:membrane-bound lytic murein transglycosylase MltF